MIKKHANMCVDHDSQRSKSKDVNRAFEESSFAIATLKISLDSSKLATRQTCSIF